MWGNTWQKQHDPEKQLNTDFELVAENVFVLHLSFNTAYQERFTFVCFDIYCYWTNFAFFWVILTRRRQKMSRSCPPKL